MEIRDQVFIVTGGASGLGAGTTRALAEAGGKVVIADLNEAAGAALAQEIGGRFVRCDVSSEADGQAAVQAATSLGALAGLVNCAGIARRRARWARPDRTRSTSSRASSTST